MTRARRPDDLTSDVAGARAVENKIAELLRSDRRLTDVVDRRSSFDELDFSFRFHSMAVTVDVKEKRQRYSQGIRDLWPSLIEPDMFIVDETVFRKGKLIVDLGCAHSGTTMSVDLIVRAIRVSTAWRSRVEPYSIRGAELPDAETQTLKGPGGRTRLPPN